MAGLGSLYGFIGQPEKGLRLLKGARELDPYFGPAWYWHALGNAYFIARQYDEAIATFVRSRALPEWAHARLAACYALSARPDEARWHVAEALRLTPGYSIARAAAKEPFKQASDLQHLIDGLRKAGIPE